MITIEQVKENPTLTDRFIKENKGLILDIIKKNFTSALNRDDLQDVIQEANLALYKAILKFDISKGFKFSTYAVNTIIGNIKNYYRSGVDNLGLSVKVDMRLQWKKYNFLNSRGFTDEEIAKKIQISYEELLELKNYMRAVTSLDSLLADEESEANIYDVLPSEYDLQEETEYKEEINTKAFLIKKYLSDKHYKAIMLRLNDISHKEIAKELGIREKRERELFNDIKKNFEYITQYYDGLITSRELINRINGKSDDMPKNKNKMKYDDVVKAIAKWAINNPGQSINRKCIDPDVEIVGGSFGDAKLNAIQLLRSNGYVIEQHGAIFRLIENALEHEDEISIVEERKQIPDDLKLVSAKDLSDIMTDLVAGLSFQHDKLFNIVSQFRDSNKQLTLQDKVKEMLKSTLDSVDTAAIGYNKGFYVGKIEALENVLKILND